MFIIIVSQDLHDLPALLSILEYCRFKHQNLFLMLGIIEFFYQLSCIYLWVMLVIKFRFMINTKSMLISKYVFVAKIYEFLPIYMWYWLTLVHCSKICSLLHQRYKDFSPSLVEGLMKVFFPGKSGDDLDADRNLKAMKKRSTLKLLLELYFIGIIEDSSIFINIIKDLTSIEHLKDRDATQTNLTLLASFARQGRIFLGLPLSGPGQELYEEVQTSPFYFYIIWTSLNLSLLLYP